MTKTTHKKIKSNKNQILKCATGIKGFDEITEGGLPKDRITLITGNTGSGKTLMGLDFLFNGATTYNEPGILMTFEETEDELYKNVASLNMDLEGLVLRKKIILDYVVLERRDIQDKGDFNLEGLFIRLENAIEAVGAKRLVLDSIESLFAGITDPGILRLEIKRLFRWIKEKKLTAIVTGELGQGAFTRHGLEEYISDCIIVLDKRIKNEISTRRICIVKYRGSNHGTNEYPFVIDDDGLSVIPITSKGLDNPGSSKKIPTGIPALDKLFKGKGYSKGSTILVSGTAGTGKTSIAAALVVETCKRKKRCLFLSYEESSGQLVQNMKSIGINFEPLIKKGFLKIVSVRPSNFGLEKHLLDLYKLIESFKPEVVVIDPLTSLIGQGDPREVQSMITRMIDVLKSHGITGFFTSLVSSSAQNDTSGEIGVSSLIDTWIVVRELEGKEGKKRFRGLFIVKSRGTAHSSDVQKLIMSDEGINLSPMADEEAASMNKKKLVGRSGADAKNKKQYNKEY